MAGHANSLKAILFALGANFAIFVAKMVAAVITGSGAMLAEAIHSLADCGNQGLLLFGMRQAKRPPSDEHPLGWGKALYFWSFLVAILLFSVGGMFSLYEGLHKLSEPEPLRAPWLAVGVLVFGIVVEMISFKACLREVDKLREGRGYWTWFRHSRNSELIVIFGEDLAALLGLVLALIAVLLTMLTGNPLFDALGTLSIGVLLIVIAVLVAVEVKALLIGQGVDPVERRRILDFLEAQPEVDAVLNLVSLHMGADVMLSVKARMASQSSDTALVAAINAVEQRLRARFTQISWCFFEPDVAD
ncbi:MAG TPA: cation diffusion facilitator family transporter [Rhodanobacteraceae bacterium]|nr:cation diffusion facilitator family transporter [Rhodanobacteraceae bacterium]